MLLSFLGPKTVETAHGLRLSLTDPLDIKYQLINLHLNLHGLLRIHPIGGFGWRNGFRDVVNVMLYGSFRGNSKGISLGKT